MSEVELEEAPSVRSSIEDAIKTLEPVETDETEVVVEEPVEEVTEEVEGESGATLPEAVEEQEETEQASEEVEEVEEAILAPASWSKEDRDDWGEIPRKQQETIARREQERESAFTQRSQELAPLRNVVEANEDYFRQIGISPAESFSALLIAEKTLRTGTPQQKSDMLQRLARDYGADMPVTQVQPSEPQMDEFGFPIEPDQTQVIQQAVEQAIEPIRNDLQSRQFAEEQARQAQEAETARATSEQFFSELQGANPVERPEVRYIEEVLPQFDSMVARESANGVKLDAKALHGVFEAAAWATPTVRAKMLQDSTPTTEGEKVVTKRTVRKASSPSSSAGRGSAHSDDVPLDESVRDTLRRSMDELTEGTL